MASDRDTLAEALGNAWDDGNATGLDGYIGPGRGAGEIDNEAVRARRCEIDRILDGPLVGWRPPAREITTAALTALIAEGRRLYTAAAIDTGGRIVLATEGEDTTTTDLIIWMGNNLPALLDALDETSAEGESRA